MDVCLSEVETLILVGICVLLLFFGGMFFGLGFFIFMFGAFC